MGASVVHYFLSIGSGVGWSLVLELDSVSIPSLFSQICFFGTFHKLTVILSGDGMASFKETIHHHNSGMKNSAITLSADGVTLALFGVGVDVSCHCIVSSFLSHCSC